VEPMKQLNTDIKNLNNLTRMQMEQIIIHLKSEVTKYKSKVQEYEDDYHYNQLKKLKTDNKRLKNDLKENEKRINILEDEKSSLRLKVVELEEEIKMSMAKYERMKISYEQESEKKNENILKAQKKVKKQKLLQKELEKFVLSLTEELNEPLLNQIMNPNDNGIEAREENNLDPVVDQAELEDKNCNLEIVDKENKKSTEIKINLRVAEVHRELEKEKSNLETYQMMMENKIKNLAFLQANDNGKKFQTQIDMLGKQINECGKMITNTRLLIRQLDSETKCNE
jgi:hypothetical protein